ncbi:mitochondrial intermediate peptidase [Calocera cornea HHB12733]|uniref:mitochondrial intermediate peptidase n=1 Tax=Calocera cornea HHB12733 TaxID=1353952 RepID=A0A165GH94_9BASI|nr:mitochondrial intermediate peptidase [Calocera cornea HHB12733]
MSLLRFTPKIYRFKGCLNVPKSPCRRGYALASVSQPVLRSSAGVQADDNALRQVFDEPMHPQLNPGLKPTGLFGYPEMSSPGSIIALGERTLSRAKVLVTRAKQARQSRSELRLLVKTLDRLSDMLCMVIDMCELVRHAHPDPQISGAANSVYEYLCSYMNTLNTDIELHDTLAVFLTDSEMLASTTYEEQQVARIFLYDFEKSGIHLPDADRQRCVQLSDEILVLGSRFLQQASSTRPSYEMPIELLDGMASSYRQEVISTSSSRWHSKNLRITPHSRAHYLVSRFAPNEEARKRAFVGANTSSEGQISNLENLLGARTKLAKLIGYDSYAQMALGNTMAKQPDHVLQFLRTLSEHHRPAAAANAHAIALAKQIQLDLPSPPALLPWDRDFYSPLVPTTHSHMSLSSFFSLGIVLQGLSRLFTRLYGILLRPASMAQGESWHQDVRKLEVVDETEGLIGYIYLDPWTRDGKSSGAAHYTVRCSRRVDDDDIAGDAVAAKDEDIDLALPLQVPSVRTSGKIGKYQLPIIVLMCDVGPSHSLPSLLTWPEVETVFHEMGHAIHSMIGRTDYHNVAGTRCATDFVELPSILMEHLVASPACVGLFARHHKTDLALPYEELRKHMAANDQFAALNSQHQIMLAALDQVLHSAVHEDSTTEWARLHETMGVLPYAPGTSWQTQFGHLFSYGATYYSYLFDRAIASRVFDVVFSGNEGDLNREMGERFKERVLKWGGGKEPWELVGDVLEDEVIAEGGKAAMTEVGKWGIGDETQS